WPAEARPLALTAVPVSARASLRLVRSGICALRAGGLMSAGSTFRPSSLSLPAGVRWVAGPAPPARSPAIGSAAEAGRNWVPVFVRDRFLFTQAPWRA